MNAFSKSGLGENTFLSWRSHQPLLPKEFRKFELDCCNHVLCGRPLSSRLKPVTVHAGYAAFIVTGCYMCAWLCVQCGVSP